jgi:hypothetical protein
MKMIDILTFHLFELTLNERFSADQTIVANVVFEWFTKKLRGDH